VLLRGVFEPASRRDQVSHLEVRAVALAPAPDHAGRGGAVGVGGERVHVDARQPRLGFDPPVDDEHTARREMARHPRHRLRERVGIIEVADRAEQARDGVEGATEVERVHVPERKRYLGQPRARHLEETRLEVDAGNIGEGRAEQLEMPAGATRDIEQRRRRGVPASDQRDERRRLRLVVLEGVQEVVQVRGAVEHGSAYRRTRPDPTRGGRPAAC
jgi:hypothetical protein